MTEESAPLPCPFCGSPHITTVMGSSYKYIVANCVDCGAQSGEVRAMQGHEENRRRAIETWNKRA